MVFRWARNNNFENIFRRPLGGARLGLGRVERGPEECGPGAPGQSVKSLHFEYAISLADARVVRRPAVQHRADVLQRRVQLSINALQLAAFADLAANVEAEPGDALGDRDFPRTRRHFRRHRSPSTTLHQPYARETKRDNHATDRGPEERIESTMRVRILFI